MKLSDRKLLANRTKEIKQILKDGYQNIAPVIVVETSVGKRYRYINDNGVFSKWLTETEFYNGQYSRAV